MLSNTGNGTIVSNVIDIDGNQSEPSGNQKIATEPSWNQKISSGRNHTHSTEPS